MSVRDHLDAAVRRAGSVAALGAICGVTNDAIRKARKVGRCVPEHAVAIEAALGIPRGGLCPKAFGPGPRDPRLAHRGRVALTARRDAA